MSKSPVQWAIEPLRKYATFAGRASRAEFWWFALAMLLAYLVLWAILIGTIGGALATQGEPGAGLTALLGGTGLVLLLFWFALLIPTLAVQTRRLHDTGRSGWWLFGFYGMYVGIIVMTFGSMGVAAATGSSDASLGVLGISMILNLVWFIYAIVLLVFYVLPGNRGANKFGPDPYGEDYDRIFS